MPITMTSATPQPTRPLWPICAVLVLVVVAGAWATPALAQNGDGLPAAQTIPAEAEAEDQHGDQTLWGSIQDMPAVYAAISLLLFLPLGFFLPPLVGGFLMRKAQQTETPLDDILVASLQSAVRWALFLAGILFALFFLTLEPAPTFEMGFAIARSQAWFSPSLLTAIWLVVAAFLWHAVDFVNVALGYTITERRSRLDDVLAPVVTRALRIVVAIIVLVGILASLGMNVVGIGIAIAVLLVLLVMFGHAEVGNLVGALALVSDRPFEIGDVVRIDDRVGTIAEVGLRSTRLTTPDRTVLVVPNSEMNRATVENLSIRPLRRFRHLLLLSPATDPDQVERLVKGVRDVLLAEPKVDRKILATEPDATDESAGPAGAPPMAAVATSTDPLVVMLGFGERGLEVLVQYWLREPSFVTAAELSHRLNLNILGMVSQMGITLTAKPQAVEIPRFPGDAVQPETAEPREEPEVAAPKPKAKTAKKAKAKKKTAKKTSKSKSKSKSKKSKSKSKGQSGSDSDAKDGD